MRLAMFAAALALVAAPGLSCGGNGGRLSYPELQQKASAICLGYHRALAKLGPPTTLPKLATVARGAYRLGRSEVRRLSQLRPPEDAAAQYARMLEGFRRADALLPPVWRAAEAKRVAAARTLIRRGRAAVAVADRQAVEIGLADCRRS